MGSNQEASKFWILKIDRRVSTDISDTSSDISGNQSGNMGGGSGGGKSKRNNNDNDNDSMTNNKGNKFKKPKAHIYARSGLNIIEDKTVYDSQQIQVKTNNFFFVFCFPFFSLFFCVQK